MGQKWVKKGFSQRDPRPFVMLKQVFLARFEPVVTRFGPRKISKCIENGPVWEQKWVKKGAKTRLSKSAPVPSGVHKQMKLAPFEPVLTKFSPFRHMYEPSCTLHTYRRAVWWSHLELGRGV